MADNGRVSRHRGKPRGAWRTLGLLLAWGLTAVGAGCALLYVVPELQMVNRRLAMVASFIPYGIFAWAAAVVLFVAFGRGWGKTLALLALPGLVAQFIWASGYLPNLMSTSGRVGASVFTLNSRCNSSGREDLAATLLKRQPDLAVLQGTWTSAGEYLGESGVWNVYPYRVYFPMPDLQTCGTFVYSKSPLSRAAVSTTEQPAVRVTLDGVEVVLVPVDAPGPQDGLTEWDAAIGRIGQTASAAASEGWPVVVAGDFNAVREHLPYRRLIGQAGLVDAVQASGSGWLPTYRADSWYVPLIQIDHVLVAPDIDVGTVESVRIGSRHAHLGLIAWLQVS